MSYSARRRAKMRKSIAMSSDTNVVTAVNILSLMGKATLEFYQKNIDKIDLGRVEVCSKGLHKGKVTKTQLKKAMA